MQLYQADPKLHQELGRGDLLIIDEASFISLKQGHAEFERAVKNGVRVLLVGDVDQGRSIEAGDYFRMAMKMGVHTAELHDIRRQSPDALDGHYLKAVKLFKKGRSTEAFKELLSADCIHEVSGQARVEAIADSILRSKAQGIPAMCSNFTHRENDAISACLRKKMKGLGQLIDERMLIVHGTLGWSDAQKKDVSKLKTGHVLEITRGKDKGVDWTVIDQSNGHVYAKNAAGEVRTFTKAHYKLFDVCQQRELPVAIGDDLFARSANKRGELINGARLTVAGWDELGNPIDSNGRSIEHRNLCHAYASTARKVQGSAATRIITGFDRHSVKAATQDVPYVINSRGREFCEIYVESIADLAQIQNRSGDRKTVTEMGVNAETLPRALSKLVEQMQREPEKEKRQVNPKEIDLQSGKRIGEGKVLENAESKIANDMARIAAQQAFPKSRDHGYEYER